ncbi:MAG: hypothetical protein QM770_02155 [Tepidisphaeraceae bacterium]
MSDSAVRLTREQRELVETAIHELALRFEWAIHAIAAQSEQCMSLLPQSAPVIRCAKR